MSQARELAPHKIRVNAIAPGFIDNRLFPGERGERYDNYNVRAETEILLGPGKPSDIAGAAVYLASDDARYVTGTYILVDGGMLLPPITEILGRPPCDADGRGVRGRIDAAESRLRRDVHPPGKVRGHLRLRPRSRDRRADATLHVRRGRSTRRSGLRPEQRFLFAVNETASPPARATGEVASYADRPGDRRADLAQPPADPRRRALPPDHRSGRAVPVRGQPRARHGRRCCPIDADGRLGPATRRAAARGLRPGPDPAGAARPLRRPSTRPGSACWSPTRASTR